MARSRDLGRGIVCPQKRRSGKPWATLCTTARLHAQFLEPLGAASVWDAGPGSHSALATGSQFRAYTSAWEVFSFYEQVPTC